MIEGKLVKKEDAELLLEEATQLTKIFAATHISAKNNR
jgi:hypothetical protein